ncbi:MAG: hypothetical protein QF486_00635 [Candidatus Woesearchaeota archaeon]|jgi:hypothetical protein|nr:hypothetical protein [Candidatus Woesearchaeota archaeon]MDP7181273.1 hypothetical protein [Candidatus Woesearchaeota archaeon]MDP7198108.1 hypothetical protein [Candidatus Woesearchaeota archaeon]MDP7466942.1 hypothetical protein [Candidatus Woesearchaeota archaeon]MDP7646973.1 hypothetical protein [Candidatus Woesearchaeota archaeon]|tara:strand:- start:760 stop:972 length:213 start_codon:yes stop_codon:yes gene_type:complete
MDAFGLDPEDFVDVYDAESCGLSAFEGMREYAESEGNPVLEEYLRVEEDLRMLLAVVAPQAITSHVKVQT